MRLDNQKRLLTSLEYGLILLCFFICLTGALMLPTEQCPDEVHRSALIQYMFHHGRLPTGDEEETLSLSSLCPNYGFSYALRPYLPSIIGALFMRTAAVFTDSPSVLLLAARLCSVLSVTGCCCFCLLLGRRLFGRRSSAILFAVLVCFLPQVMFLGMYHNNDAPSLFAVCMMLYFLVDGYSRRWPVSCCVGLAVAFSIGLLTYYSIYGWILMSALFCVVSVLMDRGIPDKRGLILKRTLLVSVLCLLFAGWFFVRNAMLHDGDFLGIAYEEVSRARVEAMGFPLHQYECYRRDGFSLLEFFCRKDYDWLRKSAQSFVGIFANMTLYLPMGLYGVYAAVFAFGALLTLSVLIRRRPCRRDALLLSVMTVSVGINIVLHFWQCYARDYQPQGRYAISTIVLLGYLLAYGLDSVTVVVDGTEKKEPPLTLQPAAVLTVVWLLLFAEAFFGTMTKMLQ